MKIKLPEDVTKELSKKRDVLVLLCADIVFAMVVPLFFAFTGVVTHFLLEHAVAANTDPMFRAVLAVVDGVALALHGAAIVWVLWKAFWRFVKNLE